MQMNLYDASKVLHVSDSMVIRWIWQQGLPCQRVAGKYWFNRAELIEWALAHQINIDCAMQDLQNAASLFEALEAGGIYNGLPGQTHDAALRAIVTRLPLPRDFDKRHLLQLYQARGTQSWRVVGDGIAVPGVHHPIVLAVPQALATLSYLEQAIICDVPVVQPVRIIFNLISPTTRAHLRLLSTLSSALREPSFRACVLGMKPPNIILGEARRIEERERRAASIKPRAA